MAIVRRSREAGRFAVLHKQGLEDPRLSFKARGLLAYLLTKPDGWRVSTSHLVRSGPDGKDAVASAMNELMECGYAARVECRESGQFAGYDYIINDSPVDEPCGFPAGDGFTASGKTASGKTAPSKNDVSKNEFTDSCDGHSRKNGGPTHTYDPGFLEVWGELPARSGTDSKPDAEKQYLTRVREGFKHEEILAGAKRYAAFCDADGSTGTTFVMQGARFFGKGRHWEAQYEIPAASARGRNSFIAGG